MSDEKAAVEEPQEEARAEVRTIPVKVVALAVDTTIHEISQQVDLGLHPEETPEEGIIRYRAELYSRILEAQVDWISIGNTLYSLDAITMIRVELG